MSTNNLSERIIKKAKDLGYIDCGITDVSPFDIFADKVKARIDYFPEAKSFYEDLLNRIDPRERFSEAKSLVVCIWRYGQYKIPGNVDQYIGKNYLFDGRKNYSDNYIARKSFENYMDEMGLEYRKGGVPDRWAAVRAGVGNFARNNFIYTAAGSWVNVETWLIDQEVDYVHDKQTTPCPEGCQKCIKACPTDALSAPFQMNPLKCIPYLTYNHPGLTPEKYRKDMGTWLYGCDVCQNVCPLNKGQWSEKKEYPGLEQIAPHIEPVAIYTMDEDFFQEEIYSRYFYSKDINRWKMNALRAMANTGKKEYLNYLKEAAESDEPRLKEMGKWGLRILQDKI